MKNRAILVLLAAVMACTIWIFAASAAEEKESCHPVPADVSEMPSSMGLGSGDIHNNTGLEVSHKLNKHNGEYADLYVENNGANSVVATINGQNEKIFKAGETGHVYLEVTQGFLGLDREYMFKVVPGANGGAINIHYEITQRGAQ